MFLDTEITWKSPLSLYVFWFMSNRLKKRGELITKLEYQRKSKWKFNRNQKRVTPRDIQLSSLTSFVKQARMFFYIHIYISLFESISISILLNLEAALMKRYSEKNAADLQEDTHAEVWYK